jgi:hypothetical protein
MRRLVRNSPDPYVPTESIPRAPTVGEYNRHIRAVGDFIARREYPLADADFLDAMGDW